MSQKMNNLNKLVDNLLLDKKLTHGLKRSLKFLKRELVLFNNPRTSKVKTLTEKNLKVQIGGGDHYKKDFVNIDIFPPADILFDIREKIPLPANSVKFLFSEHFLEHIDYPKSVKKFIKESSRILASGGKIVVGVPDSERIIKAYVKKDKQVLREYINKWYKNRDNLEHFNTAIDVVNYHLRDQDDSDKYTPHLWGYDFEKLKSLLEEVGFKNIKKWKFNSKIANPKRKFGSIYVQAIKP